MSWSGSQGGGRFRPRRPDREADRRRAKSAARRRQDDTDFDPAPPTDDDWTVGDGANLRRLRGPQPVGDALEAFLGRTGFNDRVRTTRLLDDWAAIVGADVAANSRPQRIERGVLHLAVSSTGWATQLTWLESMLLEKVNEAAGTNLVQRVKVVVAPLEGPLPPA